MSTPEGEGLSDAAITMLRARLSGQKRSRLLVEINLDPVPGWGNTAEDHRVAVQRMLDDSLGHYRPTVTIVSETLEGKH